MMKLPPNRARVILARFFPQHHANGQLRRRQGQMSHLPEHQSGPEDPLLTSGRMNAQKLEQREGKNPFQKEMKTDGDYTPVERQVVTENRKKNGKTGYMDQKPKETITKGKRK